MSLRLTSNVDPTFGARGSITSPGTKRDGSHFARSVDPGTSSPNNISPFPGMTSSMISRAIKIKTDPPIMEGI